MRNRGSGRACGAVSRAALALAVLLVAAAPRTAGADGDAFAIRRLESAGRTMAADLVDLDGDARGDVFCVIFDGLPPSEKREIQVRYQRPDGTLPDAPDWTAPVPRDAAAYDLAPAAGGAGPTAIVLLRRDRLSVLSLARREPVWRELSVSADGEAVTTIAAAPDDHGLDRLRLARTGLGRVRFAVPGLGRTHLLSADGEIVARLEVGARANYWIPPRPGPLLGENELELYYDAPRLGEGDVDGDGRLDLVSSNRHELRVFLQRADGSFRDAPDRVRALKRLSLPDHIRSSGAVRSEPWDFDRDGRVDLLVSQASGGLLDAESRIAIHMNRGGDWDLTSPDQVFDVEGGIVTTQVTDLDGDGAVELIVVKTPLSVLELVEVLLTRSIDAEARIFRTVAPQARPSAVPASPGGNGSSAATAPVSAPAPAAPAPPFGSDPWHERQLDVAFSFETTRPLGFVPTIEADVNGDGHRDLLASGKGDALEIFLGNPEDGFRKRHARQELDTGGRIRFGEYDGDGLPDFVLYDPRRPNSPIRVGVNRGELPGTKRATSLRESPR